jgi:hypothetical protein
MWDVGDGCDGGGSIVGVHVSKRTRRKDLHTAFGVHLGDYNIMGTRPTSTTKSVAERELNSKHERKCHQSSKVEAPRIHCQLFIQKLLFVLVVGWKMKRAVTKEDVSLVWC